MIPSYPQHYVPIEHGVAYPPKFSNRPRRRDTKMETEELRAALALHEADPGKYGIYRDAPPRCEGTAPFPKMKVGDSYVHPMRITAGKQWNLAAAKKYGRENGMDFRGKLAIHKGVLCMRIWRIV